IAGQTFTELARNHMHEPPSNIPEELEISKETESLVMLCLSKDKACRPTLDKLIDGFSKQSKGEPLVAMVSHELRTPLMSIKGFIELLAMGAYGNVSKDILNSSEMANESIERLIGLVNDLLDAEKLQSGKFELRPRFFYLDQAIESAI